MDQNNNKTEGIYRYFSNKISLQADVINIDLTAGDEETSFGFVNGSLDQRAVIIVRNSEKNFSFSALNHSSIVAEKDFFLNLTDSSTGITVCITVLCSVAYVVIHYMLISLFYRLNKLKL